MKKIFLFILIIICSVTINAQSYVAVFDPVDEAKTGIGEVVREIFSTEISKLKNYVPVERALIQQVLKESAYQATGMVDDASVSELGKQMGANYVCISVITKIGKNYFITAKLVDVLTASIALQSYVTTENGDVDLLEKVQELSLTLFENEATINIKQKVYKNGKATIFIYRINNSSNKSLTDIKINDNVIGTLGVGKMLTQNLTKVGSYTIMVGDQSSNKFNDYIELDVKDGVNYYVVVEIKSLKVSIYSIPYENIDAEFRKLLPNWD